MSNESEYVFSLLSLPRQPGATLSIDEHLSVPNDTGVNMARVHTEDKLEVHFLLSSVNEGVYVSGSVQGKVDAQCARCLRDFSYEETFDVHELVFYPDKRAVLVEQGDEDAKEAYEIIDDHIDIEPLIRDACVLALPFTPLCSPDCLGLCSECGIPFDELDEDHHHDEKHTDEEDIFSALERQLREEEES
ncbi:MAG: DUF177 domain-containing protein [Actinomycetaceae bacterium]|nr:DUF177 domain-containing protein [Actinomycetaceae bacterium]